MNELWPGGESRIGPPVLACLRAAGGNIKSRVYPKIESNCPQGAPDRLRRPEQRLGPCPSVSKLAQLRGHDGHARRSDADSAVCPFPSLGDQEDAGRPLLVDLADASVVIPGSQAFAFELK